MSFILDALKKSESDRQRQSGPALFEVKVAAPRTGLPLWAIAIAGLLAVNLGIVMWMLWRHPATRTAATDAGPPPLAPAAAAAPQAAAAGPPAAGATTPAPAPASVPPPAPSPVLVPDPGATSGSDNPEDYAPATEPAPLPGSHVRRGTADGVPLYQDAAATPGTRIPQLRLDLHVFALRPQDRFVMINMHKLREGDSLPEGVRVDRITPEGAVLSYSGSQFLLSRD
jgi:general secretion pathway protein B